MKIVAMAHGLLTINVNPAMPSHRQTRYRYGTRYEIWATSWDSAFAAVNTVTRGRAANPNLLRRISA